MRVRRGGGAGAFIATAMRNSAETALQVQAVAALRDLVNFRALPANLVIFHVPNEGHGGGERAKVVGALRKAMGVLAGTPDLVVSLGKFVLYIELKAPKVDGKEAGRPSLSQNRFRSMVEEEGGKYVLCRSVAEVVDAVEVAFGSKNTIRLEVEAAKKKRADELKDGVW